MKKWFPLLLIVIVLLFTACSQAVPSTEYDPNAPASEGLAYVLSEDGTYYILTGIGTCTDSMIVIPDTYNGLPVSCVSARAFQCLPNITGFSIPASMTQIELLAFGGCPNLTSITVSPSNPVYHSNSNCLIETASKTLILGCQNSTVPDDGSVTAIGLAAFSLNEDEEYTTFTPKSLTIPECITSIGQSAFSGCKWLSEITLPSSITTIGSATFYYSGLSRITIPDSVTSIGDSAFYSCDQLAEIVIPNSVTTIGQAAFERCTALRSITIGSGVTSIADRLLFWCPELATITVDPANQTYRSAGNCLIETSSKTVLYGCKNSTLPNDGSITSIESDAFRCCFGLTQLHIPASITKINADMFHQCGLTQITVDPANPVYYSDGNCIIDRELQAIILGCRNSTIPNDPSVTKIWNNAFAYQVLPSHIAIPNNITYIAQGAFLHAEGLTSVFIPDSVNRIIHSAFSYCADLTEIVVDTKNPVFHSSENCLIQTSDKKLIAGCSTSIIPDDGSVTYIGQESFSGHIELTSITIPASVTKIEKWAFSGCDELTDIRFAGTVAQWEAMDRSSEWADYSLRNLPIHCVDGDVKQN